MANDKENKVKKGIQEEREVSVLKDMHNLLKDIFETMKGSTKAWNLLITCHRPQRSHPYGRKKY